MPPGLIQSKALVPAVGEAWIYQTTCGDESEIWTATITTLENREGVDCYKTETTFDTPPHRNAQGHNIVMLEPVFIWQDLASRDKIYGESSIDAGIVKVHSIQWCTDYSAGHGQPFTLGKTWTYHEHQDNGIGGEEDFDWTVEVTAIEPVTVPAGTFECYKVVSTRNDGSQIMEWWDADGIFDLAPVKKIDFFSFSEPQVHELIEPMPPMVSLASDTLWVDEDAGTAHIDVVLSPTSTEVVTVSYTTTDGTARQSDDYMAVSGTLVFAPGDTSATIAIPIMDDVLTEGHETFGLSITNPVLAHMGSPSSTNITILDDESLPDISLSAARYTITEGTSEATIRLNLSSACAMPVTIDYGTWDGSAEATADYTGACGSIAFAPGETSAFFVVPIEDDSDIESAETINLGLENPVGATLGELGPMIARLVIADNDGLRVPASHATIQDAMDAASDGDTVIVADGIYTGEGNRNLEFHGKAITVRSENGPDNCIIDCEQAGRAVYFDWDEQEDSVLDGFTITNGKANMGGGISVEKDGAPTIINCIFRHNQADGSGGRTPYGGGIFTFKANPRISNCIFWQNISTRDDGSGGYGGGVYINQGSARLSNCTFHDNTCGNKGGGLFVRWASDPVIKNCIFWQNKTDSGDYPEIRTLTCSPTIEFCDVEGGYEGAGNIDADPLFADPASGDLELMADSPCIDTGTHDAPYIPSTDIDGDPRIWPYEGIVDMGAQEYGSCPDVDLDSVCDTIDNCPKHANSDQQDTDGDGIGDACDNCTDVPNQVQSDCDSDGTGNICDGCPDDPNKTDPGYCGCGQPETDTDSDGTPDCVDGCPDDPNKTDPGYCGCGQPETDTDDDGTPDCVDGCPDDPAKTDPGVCGCGVPDTDTDSDGTPDCVDGCPDDPGKVEPGICGCGTPDTDTDGDGTLDCNDLCPNDPNKVAPGICGCGTPDTDTDGDGVMDCVDNCPNTYNPGQEDRDGDGLGDACDTLDPLAVLVGDSECYTVLYDSGSGSLVSEEWQVTVTSTETLPGAQCFKTEASFTSGTPSRIFGLDEEMQIGVELTSREEWRNRFDLGLERSVIGLNAVGMGTIEVTATSNFQETAGDYAWPFVVGQSGTLAECANVEVRGDVTLDLSMTNTWQWQVTGTESIILADASSQIKCYRVEHTWVGFASDIGPGTPSFAVEKIEWWAIDGERLGPVKRMDSTYYVGEETMLFCGEQVRCVDVNILVGLQDTTERPDPAGWEIPLTVAFFAPDADVLMDSPLYEYSVTTTKSGSKALASVGCVPCGTYDVTVDSDRTLMNVKRNVVISNDQ